MSVVKFRTFDEAKELGFDNRGSGLEVAVEEARSAAEMKAEIDNLKVLAGI